MRILVAPDSFKGTLSAEAAAEAIAAGLRDGFAGVADADAGRVESGSDPAQPEVILCPLADGGEGTASILARALDGVWVAARVTGPLWGRVVDAGFVAVPGDEPGAIVELASASGLELLAPGDRDPLRTTTTGTGELIRLAAEGGARWIWLTLGGSATVDGGTGMATALGWRFLDQSGAEVSAGGGALDSIASVGRPAEPEIRLPPITVLRDVDNPLLGPAGAAPVFGPQKGASPEVVDRLAAGLGRLADLVGEGRGVLQDRPGAGAAGGAGFGAMAFLGADMRRGFTVVAEALGLEEHMGGVDLVVTGEGRLDSQSLEGKVVGGVLEMAAGLEVPVEVVTGSCELDPEAVAAAGIRGVEVAETIGLDRDDAAERAREDVHRAGARLGARLAARSFDPRGGSGAGDRG